MIVKLLQKLITFSISLLLFCCASPNSNNSENEPIAEAAAYPDGIYCANVSYYNPNTATKSTYTLNVEVSQNKVIKIIFGNGGWIDNDHMTPMELSSEGTCLITSDKHYEYGIRIKGAQCSYIDAPKAEKMPFTFSSCASTIGMTEAERTTYQNKFNIKPDEIITVEMCEKIHSYISSSRTLNELNEAMENGYIQGTHIRKTGDFVQCNFAIVKRRSHYFLLAVAGVEKSSMGLMKFDPSITDWQEVLVQEDPGTSDVKLFQMRIVSDASDISSLQVLISRYCD